MLYPITKTEYINTDLIKKIKRLDYIYNCYDNKIPSYYYKIIYINDETETISKKDGNALLKLFGIENPEKEAEQNFTLTYLLRD